MKKDTITITRAEYAQLNKAANAAVEHACELLQAARLVDELKAENETLKAENALLVQKATTWQTWYKNLNESYRRFFTEWDIVPKN